MCYRGRKKKTHKRVEVMEEEGGYGQVKQTLGGESEYIKSGRPVKRLCRRAAGHEIRLTEAR
jgi:hypothetical protein